MSAQPSRQCNSYMRWATKQLALVGWIGHPLLQVLSASFSVGLCTGIFFMYRAYFGMIAKSTGTGFRLACVRPLRSIMGRFLQRFVMVCLTVLAMSVETM
jgi:hypothetical protein